MDDIIIKSRLFKEHIEYLREIFAVLNKYQIKLNPAKCAFFIKGKKLLSYMVSLWGIEPNPEKVQAILEML